MAEFTELYRQALSRLETGGKTLEADLADIEAGKKAAIARGQQTLVSGGLAGTTVMGAVPLSAEKTAGRARLRARGMAESKYQTALMSFANIAEAARQAKLDREAAMQRLQTQVSATGRQAELGRIAATGTTQYGITSTYGQYKPMGQFLEEFRVGGGGGGYAEQFPSLYGTMGEQAPSLMGGVSGGGYMDPTIGQPIVGGPQAGGMYLGGDRYLGPEQVELRTEQAVTQGLPPSAQKTTYKQETRGGEQVMGMYIGNRRVGSLTMEQYSALGAQR